VVVFYEMEGSAEGVEDRNVSVVDATLPCLDAGVFSVVGPIPLSSCLPIWLKTRQGLNLQLGHI
jgi:hypothetical protein